MKNTTDILLTFKPQTKYTTSNKSNLNFAKKYKLTYDTNKRTYPSTNKIRKGKKIRSRNPLIRSW